MSADLPTAILDRLTAAPLKAYDTPPAPSTAPPYTVVYFDGAPYSSDRESDQRVQRDHGWQTVTVGTSSAMVRDARERVVTALTDWTPTVTGRSLSKVEHDGTQPVRPDPAMPDRTLYIATDQWRVVSDPA